MMEKEIKLDDKIITREELEKSINDLKEVNPNCFNTVKKLPAA